jgi:hypothetical protein
MGVQAIWRSRQSRFKRIGAATESPVRMSIAVWHVATRRQATLWPSARPARRFAHKMIAVRYVFARIETQRPPALLLCLNLGRKLGPASPPNMLRPGEIKAWLAVRCDGASNQRISGKSGQLRPTNRLRASARRACARRSNCPAPVGSAPSDRRSRYAAPTLVARASRPRPGPHRRPRSDHAER